MYTSNKFGNITIMVPFWNKYRTSCELCRANKRFISYPDRTIVDHCDESRIKSGNKNCRDCASSNAYWKICPFDKEMENVSVLKYRCESCFNKVMEDVAKIPYTSKFNPHAPVFT